MVVKGHRNKFINLFERFTVCFLLPFCGKPPEPDQRRSHHSRLDRQTFHVWSIRSSMEPTTSCPIQRRCAAAQRRTAVPSGHVGWLLGTIGDWMGHVDIPLLVLWRCKKLFARGTDKAMLKVVFVGTPAFWMLMIATPYDPCPHNYIYNTYG